MDVFFTYVLPIAAFILGLISSWDKLVDLSKAFFKKQKAKKLELVQLELDKVHQFNENSNFLIAYLFKQFTILVTIIFFTSILDILPTVSALSLQIKAFIFGVLSWVMGYKSGRIFKAANYVINRQKIEESLNKKVSKYTEVV